MPAVATTLSAAAVVEAGCDLVHSEGWDALSVRGVAGRLGVTPMALYRHVEGGDALRRAVIGRIAEGIEAVPRSGDTTADLEAWARTAHTALAEYPGAAAHLLVTWFEVPAALRAVESLLGVVHDVGVGGFEAVAAVNAVFMYVLMRAEAERTVRGAGVVKRSLRLAGGAETFPLLASLAPHYTTARFDLHFEYGLRVLLSGIAREWGSAS